MHWYNSHSLHIYAPSREPYGKNWVEQLLGEVIKPLLSEYDRSISWLWVTRYAGPYDEAKPPQGVPLPDNFRAAGVYRYIVLRLHVSPQRPGMQFTKLPSASRKTPAASSNHAAGFHTSRLRTLAVTGSSGTMQSLKIEMNEQG